MRQRATCSVWVNASWSRSSVGLKLALFMHRKRNFRHQYGSTMPRRRKLQLGVGANGHVLLRLVHPSKHVRERYPNLGKNQQLNSCRVKGIGNEIVSGSGR